MKNYNGNIVFEHSPRIAGYASVVGKKEGEGPLRDYFDRIIHDSYAGKDTFEQAESRMMSVAVQSALDKGHFSPADIDLACCGDLLNQCVASSFAMRRFGIPYAGIYGACSTMALSMIVAAVAADSGAARRAVCASSSHYCTAERQYRFPLEYGSQRPPTAQWTVTGAGACVIESEGGSDTERNSGEIGAYTNTASKDGAATASGNLPTLQNSAMPVIRAARLGRIVDYSITDQNNMGAAMAPAVVKMGT
ncbi:MAG: hypothetical protein IJH07_05770 [Ruminococcus sp.]|nr:hypothetical protein [Ruminococcus sp.]